MKPIPTSVAFLLLALPSTAQVLRTHEGSFSEGELGAEIALVGDCDGDGVEDYAIGQAVVNFSFGGVPSVWLRSGATGDVIWRVEEIGVGRLGEHVARVGDIDLDGVPDVLVSAGRDELGVRVLSGVDGSTLRTHAGFLGPKKPKDLDGVGDLNLDGVGDYVVGAQSSISSPRVVAFSGADGVVLWESPLEVDAVEPMVDITGDGVPEVLIGASSFVVGNSLSGRAAVLDGATGAVVRSHPCSPITLSQDYGAEVCLLDDVDLDGVRDYAVGAPGPGFTLNPPTWVDVYSGATGALLRRIVRTFDTGFGAGLANAGDIDGDGRGDICIGSKKDSCATFAPAVARVFSASSGRVLAAISGTGGVGDAICRAPDLDGDGRPEFLVGNGCYSTPFGLRIGRVRIVKVEFSPDVSVRLCSPTANVTGAPGRIGMQGSTSLAADDLVLTATQLPPATFGLFIYAYATSLTTIGDGTLCLSSPSRIAPVLGTGAGSVEFPLDVGALNAFLDPVTSGDSVYFQFWCRDGGPSRSNVTDMLAIDFRD